MVTKKDFIVVALVAFCLTATIFMVVPTRSQDDKYDQWLDVNDDGVINIIDIGRMATSFGTSGVPINKTDLLLQLESRLSALEASVSALEASGSVTTDRIAEGAVVTTKLADGSVTTAKILDGTIIAVDLADGSVISAKIADGAVTTAKIADGAVVTIKLADGSVTSAKIVDGTITSVDLGSGAVTASKIAAGAVTTDKIADGAITSAKIASGVVTWASIAGKPLQVAAAGFVQSDAHVTEGYNILSVTYEGAPYYDYRISINGVSYFWIDYITIVTCGSGSARIVSTNSQGGDLLVYLYGVNGTPVQDAFQFVTFYRP